MRPGAFFLLDRARHTLIRPDTISLHQFTRGLIGHRKLTNQLLKRGSRVAAPPFPFSLRGFVAVVAVDSVGGVADVAFVVA